MSRCTHKDTEVEWTRFEVVFERKSGINGDRVRDIQSHDAQTEDSVYGFSTGECEQTEKKREEGYIEDGVNWCLSVMIHSIQPAGEWQCAITGESKSLP